MANRNVILYNPTGATVTVNAQAVPAHRAVKLVIADTTTDLYGFVAAGCWTGPSRAERAQLVNEAEESGNYIQRNADDLGDL
jgi:hypothetical protein